MTQVHARHRLRWLRAPRTGARRNAHCRPQAFRTLHQRHHSCRTSLRRSRARLEEAPQADRLAESLVPQDFDIDAADEHGRLAADLAKRGTPIGAFDAMIAAHALALKLILVTNNEKHFRKVPGLKIENWTRGARTAAQRLVAADKARHRRPNGRPTRASQLNHGPLGGIASRWTLSSGLLRVRLERVISIEARCLVTSLRSRPATSFPPTAFERCQDARGATSSHLLQLSSATADQSRSALRYA